MKEQERLLQILLRQQNFRWGDEYRPAIYAVASEAPRCSRVSRINSRKLGRVLNCLSTPERIFTQFALFNPNIIDIHEQKVLSTVNAVHPLFGHPLLKGKELPTITGTLRVAESIGMKHHTVRTVMKGQTTWAAYPYLGDLLLYLRGADGLPYAVNWNIKDTKSGFSEKNLGEVKTPRKQGLDREKMRLRVLLEELYYKSAGIRTVNMSRECLDNVLVSNIFLLYGVHERQLDLDKELLSDFTSDLAISVSSGDPLAYVAIDYAKRWGSRDQFIARIYQDIWFRRLKVNMFKPVLIDRPSELEEVEVHSVYASYFAER